MKRYLHCFYVFMFSFAVIANIGIVQAVPSAKALLKGVEKEYSKHKVYQASFTVVYGEDETLLRNKTTECTVDVSPGKMRFEQRISNKNSEFSNEIIFIDKDEVYLYRSSYHGVQLMDMQMATKRGTYAFDPRLLLTCSTPAINSTLQEQLNYLPDYGYDDGVVAKETVNGVDVWHVCFTNEFGRGHLWIEEPSFRVHKLRSETTNVISEVLAKYESLQFDIFPTQIHIENVTRGKRTICRDFKFTNVTFNKPNKDRFSLKSMELPINTPVTDIKILKIIGYWDGEKLVDDPVKMSIQERREWEEKSKQQSSKQQPLGIGRYVFIISGLLLMVVAI
ncbi:MAG: hypothetical protein LBF88_14025, partial [Planctomycetaceae bacterium]|nr:hypothetical protein [Planctomycetaceae bacterium]